MKKFCSQSLRRVKTDKIDSVQIANFGLTYWNELVPTLPAGEVYHELKLLARQYYQTVSLLVKAKVNLSNLIDQTMPGINKIMSDQSNHKLTDLFISTTSPKWVRSVLLWIIALGQRKRDTV